MKLNKILFIGVIIAGIFTPIPSCKQQNPQINNYEIKKQIQEQNYFDVIKDPYYNIG